MSLMLLLTCGIVLIQTVFTFQLSNEISKWNRIKLIRSLRIIPEKSEVLSCESIHRPIDHERRFFELSANIQESYSLPTFALLSVAISLLIAPEFAEANEYGILAGKTASMLHPVTNILLFGTSIYSAYLGLQWRRLREIGEELRTLNAKLPILSTGPASTPLDKQLSAIVAELSNLQLKNESASEKFQQLSNDRMLLEGSMELNTEIVDLTSTRKKLLGANLKDKHHTTGSVLLGAGVSVSLLGAFNTYMRAGKLFPGPHLFAGMAITILWAVAAALVPAMQKGNEAARVAHIGLNTLNIALFAWQVVTGLDIMLKVWEKTPWP